MIHAMLTIFSCFTGCCFVTFYTRKAALEAQNALHNIKTLPGVSFDPSLHIVFQASERAEVRRER